MADLDNPYVRSNSSVPTEFDTLQFRSQAPNGNPANKIDVKVKGKSIDQLQFPTDIGKYKFVILESDLVNFTQLNFERTYVLPFPIGLMEHYATNYDQNWGYLQSAVSAIPGKGGSTTLERTGSAIVSALGTSGAAALGLSVNQMRTIILKNPDFRVHNFAWKLSPKTFEESNLIRGIIDGMRTGMAPRLFGNDFLYGFPKIYSMFFVPNMHYLYKFKPCVLQSIDVDYQGGHPAPAFYSKGQTTAVSGKFDQNGKANNAISGFGQGAVGAVESLTGANFKANVPGQEQSYELFAADSPPESVVIRTKWLELEQWTEEDFVRDGGFANSSDPFSAYAYYNR